MTSYFPAGLDIHRGDPHWDGWEEGDPRPGTAYLAHSALVRSRPPRSAGRAPTTVPAQRVPENSKENVT